MDAILIYKKETGEINTVTNLPSLKTLRDDNMSAYMNKQSLLDEEGNKVGEVDVQLFDPDHGFLFAKNTLPPVLGAVHISTKTEQELLDAEIDDTYHPEIVNEIIENGAVKTFTSYGAFRVRAKKELVNGSIVLVPQKRKVITSNDINDYISDINLSAFGEFDESKQAEFLDHLMNNYKISVDAQTNKKSLVAKG